MNSTTDHLDDIYAAESEELEPWKDSPGEVSTYDWRDYLGDPRYERAYVDFFEDQLVLAGYDLKKLLNTYLFEGKEPLVNNLIAGREFFYMPLKYKIILTDTIVGHPLIHLGYAYELSSRDVAMEALGMATSVYNFLHKYLDDPKYTKPSTYSTSSPLEILERVRNDKRFDKGSDTIEAIFENHEDAIMEHWNAWQLPSPKNQFQDSQHAAVAILVATHPLSSPQPAYDFFLVHVLTTSHAVRIILPFIPAKFHISLVRQWWLLTIAVYITQGRLKIDLANVTNYKLKGQDWSTIDKHGVQNKWSLDAHWVKALRAMKEVANTWGDADQFYLKAACRLDEEFNGWGFE